MHSFIAKIIRMKGEPQIFEGKVVVVNEKPYEGPFLEEREVYAGEDPEQVKNEFIEQVSRNVRANNVSEECRVLQDRDTNYMYSWVITELS